jgi:hypothetical protein
VADPRCALFTPQPPSSDHPVALVCVPQIDEEDCAGIVYQRMARKQPVTV